MPQAWALCLQHLRKGLAFLSVSMPLRHGGQRNAGVQKALGTGWLQGDQQRFNVHPAGWKGVISREVCTEGRKPRSEEGKTENENRSSAFLEKSCGPAQSSWPGLFTDAYDK